MLVFKFQVLICLLEIVFKVTNEVDDKHSELVDGYLAHDDDQQLVHLTLHMSQDLGDLREVLLEKHGLTFFLKAIQLIE